MKKESLGLGPVVVMHNPAPSCPDDEEEPPSSAADGSVVEVASHITRTLRGAGVDARQVCAEGDLDELLGDLVTAGVSRVFNLVESLDGDASREAEFAERLEAVGLPYTGGRPSILRVAFAKDVARSRLEALRVPVAAGHAVWDADGPPPPLPFPLFVKPARADGSIGIDGGSVVYDEAAFRARVAYLLRCCGAPVLVECYLPGPELNVAILPGPRGPRFAVTAIDFSCFPPDMPPIVTYACKWVPGTPEYEACSRPAREMVSDATVRAATRIAWTAFTALGGHGYGRVDLRCDAEGAPRVIDVNPNPDLDPEAGLARAACFEGIDYEDLILGIAAEATAENPHRDARKHHARLPRLRPAANSTRGSRAPGAAAAER